MNREWKIGKDLSFSDNVLDGFTFDELVTTVCCNCKHITQDAVRLAAKQIVDIHMQDFKYLLEKNTLDIVVEARRRRGMGAPNGGAEE